VQLVRVHAQDEVTDPEQAAALGEGAARLLREAGAH
jgi:hypothetical protein